jgi:hypothetical protein
MPLFKRRPVPSGSGLSPANTVLYAASELGTFHALDGRPPLTDPTVITNYVQVWAVARGSSSVLDHLMNLVPEFYQGGYDAGAKPPLVPLPPETHDDLNRLDAEVHRLWP